MATGGAEVCVDLERPNLEDPLNLELAFGSLLYLSACPHSETLGQRRRGPLSLESARFLRRPEGTFAMASASSSSSALHHRGPYIPLIPCPDCGRTVKRKVSGTPEHNGWTFYKCEKYGELEYVGYLIEQNYFRGDAGIDALGWAEDRRDKLMLRNVEEAATGGAARAQRAREDMLMKMLTEVVTMLKIVAGLLTVVCVVLIVKK
ncbi:hypothetical protein ACQ4PT_033736 [Festuca glaucescens]